MQNVAMAADQAGLRFTVLPQHEHEVAKLYRKAGFVPLRLEKQDDGCVTFVFASQPDERMMALLSAVPPRYSANQGFVGLPPIRGPSS